MGKKLFLFFFLFVSMAVTGLIIYIQSSSFAAFVKKQLDDKIAKNSGILIEFDRLKVDILPPGISLVDARIKILQPNNILDLPMDTAFRAEKIGATFRMVQAFSRGITVNKFFVSGAELRLNSINTDGKKKKGEKLSQIVTRPIQIQVTKNFFLNVRQIELRDTSLYLGGESEGKKWRFNIYKIHYLSLSPNAAGLNFVGNLEKINFSKEKIELKLDVFNSNVDITPQQIKIIAMDLQKGLIASHIEGKLLGSIDKLEMLKADLRILARASAESLMKEIKGPEGIKAQLLADLLVAGDINKHQITGKLEAENFSYSMWNLDKLSTNLNYDSLKLSLSNLNIEKKGGSIKAAALDLMFPLKNFQKDIELTFSNIFLNDIAGDLNKSINNLNVNINGSTKLSINAEINDDKFNLQQLTIKPQLQLRNLNLSNQTYGKVRPKKNILSIKELALDASILFKGDVVNIESGKLTLPTGIVDVQGSVSSKNGYDIVGNTEDLDIGKELSHIAEIPISGIGGLMIHVRGKPEQLFLDFDLDVDGAKYVNFDFGSLFGRVTLDDDKSILYLKKIKALKNDSTYSIDGLVDIGDTDRMELKAHFIDTKPDDVFSIFKKQIEHISWIPWGMTGFLRGDVDISGGYDDWEKSLLVQAKLFASKLNYKGEFISNVEADAGFDRGVYYAKGVQLNKYNTFGTGELYYYPNDVLKYNFQIHRGKIRDLNKISDLELPVDATWSASGSGEGTWAELKSHAEVLIDNATVRTWPVPTTKLTLDTDAEKIRFAIANLQKEDLLQLTIGQKNYSHSSLNIDFTNHNFSYLLCFINKRLCADTNLNLIAGIKLSTDWSGKNWKEMNGIGEINDLWVGKAGFTIRSNPKKSFKIIHGLVQLPHLNFYGEDTRLDLDASGLVEGRNLKINAKGYLSLKVLEFITSLIEESRGKLDIDASLYGDLDKTQLSGAIAIGNGFMRFSGLDATAQNIIGKIRLFNNRAQIDSIVGLFGGGSVKIGGNADIFLNRAPVLNLELNLRDNRVKFFPVNFAEVEEGKLTFTGEGPPYLLGGLIKTRQAMMRNNFDMGGNQQKLRTARYLPVRPGASKAIYEVKIKAIAEKGIFVDNDLLNAEFRGEVTLLNNFEFPKVIGRAELVKGKLLFRNTSFDLDHAYVRLANPDIFDPQFSIGGLANVDIYKINIFASGTMDDPKITLSSTPSLAQQDILSLLAFGFRGEDAKKVRSNDMSVLTYSEVGSALIDQLRINKDLQSKGVRLTVAPSFNRQSEANIVRPSEVGADTASPKVLVQSQIFKNLDATLGSTFGASQAQEMDATLEYKLGKKSSINIIYEQESTLEANESKTSLGADLKFRWGFK